MSLWFKRHSPYWKYLFSVVCWQNNMWFPAERCCGWHGMSDGLLKCPHFLSDMGCTVYFLDLLCESCLSQHCKCSLKGTRWGICTVEHFKGTNALTRGWRRSPLLQTQACMFWFWKCKGTKAFYKGHHEEIVNLYWSIFRAPRHWQGGIEAITFLASVQFQAWNIHHPSLGWKISFLCRSMFFLKFSYFLSLHLLLQCCIDNNEAMMKLLVEHGADVNVTDRELWTPLHASSTCGHVNLARFLVDK